MSMLDWAEREVALACEKERADASEDEWNYGVACYESALKAYKSLLEDGHSGMSFSFTKTILNRLIESKPLTPIEDTPNMWNEVGAFKYSENTGVYQCKRMSGLFKHINADSSVTYKDVNRVLCVSEGADGQDSTYHSGLVTRIMNEMFPIAMPYYPPVRPYLVRCEEFLINPENGDFDTVGILYAITPDGDTVYINRFFTEGGGGSWKELMKSEYEDLKSKGVDRK